MAIDAPVLGRAAAPRGGFPRGAAPIGLILLFSMMSLSLTPNLWSFNTSGRDNEQLKDGSSYAKDPDDFSLARTQSFEFFDDITNDNWKKLQDLVAHHWNHKFPEAPLTHHPAWKGRGQLARWQVRHPAWYQTNFEPNFSCQFEMRVGATGKVSRGNGDGPKWICDPHRIKRLAAERKAKDPNHPGCVIYSIGSAGDFSFEKGMEEILGPNTCEYHIFDMGDFEGKMKLQNISRAYYHRWGLDKQGEENIEPGANFYGLKDTVKLLGHDNLDVIDVFKIDCEKCEWRIYRDWLLPGLPSLQQIQVEIHSGGLGKMNELDNHDHDITPEIPFFDFLEEAGDVRFHKEPNIQYNDGSCEEYAFLKLEKEFFAPRKKVLAERNITRVDISSSPKAQETLVASTSKVPKNVIQRDDGKGNFAREERHPGDTSAQETLTTRNFPESVIQRNAGAGWKMINFLDIEIDEGICDVVNFISTTGNSAKMCVHKKNDVVSNAIRRTKRWGDCDPLPRRWNESKSGAKNEVYVEIGANIGSCVMEMLLSTDAKIVAFEPTLRNYQLLSKTIQLLGPEYQQRVALFPIGLGSESVKSQVYSAKENMGNSVVGKPIKDFEKQQFDAPIGIFIERLDSILSHNISIPLMKLDAQGFECQILDGMSPEIAISIKRIKFELAQEWLRQQDCTDFLPHLRNFGFTITNEKGGVIASDSVNCGVCVMRMQPENEMMKETE